MKTRTFMEQEIRDIIKKVKILIVTAAEPEKRALLNVMKPMLKQKEILTIVIYMFRSNG